MNMLGFKLEKRDFRLIEHVYFFPVALFVGRKLISIFSPVVVLFVGGKLSDFIQWLWKSIQKQVKN